MNGAAPGARLLGAGLLIVSLCLSAGCTAMLMGGGGTGGTSGGGATDDGRLAERVSAALVADAEIDASDITVEASRQVVFLRGSVPTAGQRVRAGGVAAAVDGVGAVRNHLRVPTD
ncbi:MAG: BON domain-containing protein [Gammaproteobacteria bacterium]|nr:BON domain-containing protein [Gammaproteobacteria bacterium]